jgi:hypothetical protein
MEPFIAPATVDSLPSGVALIHAVIAYGTAPWGCAVPDHARVPTNHGKASRQARGRNATDRCGQ